MVVIKYKVKCCKCRKNYVIATTRTKYPICYECQKNELQGDIKDPKMKKLLNIPEKLYKKNYFLRNIKINYLKWGKLSDKQIEAFKKAVKKEIQDSK